MQGLLLVDKPQGISSFGVVAKVRWLIKDATGQKVKVGHSGTLDPAATGLLILAIGSYTKQLTGLIGHDKSYLVGMTLGKSSSTGDSEGELTNISDRRPSKHEIEAVLAKFTGTLQQTPPIYSAIKVDGVRAYDLARQGKNVELKARPVRVYSNTIVSYDYPVVVFNAAVSSGTYIRSLVQDMGESLQTGAYTGNLRRTSIGGYNVKDALALNSLTYPKIAAVLITLVN